MLKIFKKTFNIFSLDYVKYWNGRGGCTSRNLSKKKSDKTITWVHMDTIETKQGYNRKHTTVMGKCGQ